MSRPVVIVGEALLDVITPHARPERPVHASIRVRAGGCLTHASLGAAAAGADVTAVGRIGRDAAGVAIEAALRERRADPRLAVDPVLPTGTFVQCGDGAAKAIAVDRGASAALELADVEAAAEAGALLVSGYLLLHDDTASAASHALRLARGVRKGVTTGSAELVRAVGVGEFHRLAGAADVVFANAKEAREVTGREGAAAASELACRYEIAVVTDEARPAFAAARDGSTACVTPPSAESPDPGAGDRLAGAMLAALARGATLAYALWLGCQTATEGG